MSFYRAWLFIRAVLWMIQWQFVMLVVMGVKLEWDRSGVSIRGKGIYRFMKGEMLEGLGIERKDLGA